MQLLYIKSSIAILLLFIVLSLNGQNLIVWKGGFPGQESEWNLPQNWEGNQLPDEDSYVIIKWINSGHNAQPILNSFTKITSLEVHADAQLVIGQQGELVIDGSYNYSSGVLLYNGKVKNDGSIRIVGVDSNFNIDMITGTGITIMDQYLADEQNYYSK